MRAPKFWYEPNSWKATFLLPLGYLYNLLTYLRGKTGKHLKYNCLTIFFSSPNGIFVYDKSFNDFYYSDYLLKDIRDKNIT